MKPAAVQQAVWRPASVLTVVVYLSILATASGLNAPAMAAAVSSPGTAISRQQLQNEVNARLLQGQWLASLSVQGGEPDTLFLPVWQRNSGRRAQRIRLQLSEEQFAQAQFENTDQGYRLLDSDRYSRQGQQRIAAIWVEHDYPRSRFPRRLEFEQRIEDYRKRQGPQSVVAVLALKRRQIVFSQGFGQRDGKTVHSRSLFELADLSQAVAGVLAARLEQEKQTRAGVPINLSLEWRTADLLPTLRGLAPHRVIDLFAHSACIPDTSVHSVEDLSRLPSVAGCAPGVLQFYAPAGFLYVEAFLEAVTGHSIEHLLREELGSGQGLHSLAVLAEAKGHRLATGLQASAHDMGELLASLLNHRILSQRTQQQRLWRKPNRHGNFTMGWKVFGPHQFGHSANTPQVSNRLWLDTRRGDAVLILASASNSIIDADQLVGSLKSLL